MFWFKPREKLLFLRCWFFSCWRWRCFLRCGGWSRFGGCFFLFGHGLSPPIKEARTGLGVCVHWSLVVIEAR